MKSTQYTFDQPRRRYEPELTIVATKRIADAQLLMKRLVGLRDAAKSTEEFESLVERYETAKQARNWWLEILEEE